MQQNIAAGSVMVSAKMIVIAAANAAIESP
jgi:hypothetical protein